MLRCTIEPFGSKHVVVKRPWAEEYCTSVTLDGYKRDVTKTDAVQGKYY